jgi:hypothetical protein
MPSLIIEEASMCWEMDYAFYAELEKAKKAEREQREQHKRAGVISDLLTEAKTQAEKAGVDAPANEPVPAK